jgi:hypothetical protein
MHDKEKRNTANVNEDIHILITCVRNSPKLHESPETNRNETALYKFTRNEIKP